MNKRKPTVFILLAIIILLTSVIIYDSGVINLFFRAPEGHVYIAPYSGERFHTFKNCKGLRDARSIELVKLGSFETNNKSLCGYCKKTAPSVITSANSAELVALLAILIVLVIVLVTILKPTRRRNAEKKANRDHCDKIKAEPVSVTHTSEQPHLPPSPTLDEAKEQTPPVPKQVPLKKTDSCNSNSTISNPTPPKANASSIIEDSSVTFSDKNLQELWNRGVRCLYHFTNVKNLNGISSYGILSRQQQKKHSIVSEFNDLLESTSNHISTSIEWPNYKMFYQKRNEKPNDTFVVLGIDIRLLAEAEYEMYSTNARTGWGISRVETASHLYYQATSRFALGNAKYPTDPQAEIRIKKHIPLKYINAVCWEDESFLNNTEIPDNIRELSSSKKYLFDKRSDYMYWGKKDG